MDLNQIYNLAARIHCHLKGFLVGLEFFEPSALHSSYPKVDQIAVRRFLSQRFRVEEDFTQLNLVPVTHHRDFIYDSLIRETLNDFQLMPEQVCETITEELLMLAGGKGGDSLMLTNGYHPWSSKPISAMAVSEDNPFLGIVLILSQEGGVLLQTCYDEDFFHEKTFHPGQYRFKKADPTSIQEAVIGHICEKREAISLHQLLRAVNRSFQEKELKIRTEVNGLTDALSGLRKEKRTYVQKREDYREIITPLPLFFETFC